MVNKKYGKIRMVKKTHCNIIPQPFFRGVSCLQGKKHGEKNRLL